MTAEAVPATLDAWFTRTAHRFADACALEVGGVGLTYGRLAALAEHVAARIRTAAAPTAVALVASRSVAAYAGYLAALRAGAAVVPLSLDAPPGRGVAMCRAAGAGAVVVDARGAGTGGEVARSLGVPVIDLTGDLWWDRLPAADAVATPGTGPDDVAYVLFTSGSTGRPKGVPIRHRQLADYLVHCTRRYEIAPGCRVSQTFELSFDPSVFDMFVTWAGGGTLVVPRREEILTPARFVAERRVTHWFSVPSVISLARRLRGLPAASMPDLRWSLFAGEQLTLDQAAAWADAAPRSVVENLYGPTEATITCTAYRLPADRARWPSTVNATVPIGRPHPHLEVVVHDGEGMADEGELWVRGSQRFTGYLDPADDAGAFAPAASAPAAGPGSGGAAWYRTGDRVHRQDGELVHLGRTDDQVKIGGFRVEPGEVEGVLRSCPGVHDVAVVAVAADDAAGGRLELHAAYTGERRGEDELTEHVRHRLPAYMVPAWLHHLPRLPVNANGKVDRRRLRELCAAAARPGGITASATVGDVYPPSR